MLTSNLFPNAVKLAYLLLYCALKTQKTWYVIVGNGLCAVPGAFVFSRRCILLYRVGRFTLLIQPGYTRRVPGTAHRPFPTVSLVGCTVQSHGLYLLRCMAMNHRRYIAWFHSNTRVVFGTWRAVAATCGPHRCCKCQNPKSSRLKNRGDFVRMEK